MPRLVRIAKPRVHVIPDCNSTLESGLQCQVEGAQCNGCISSMIRLLPRSLVTHNIEESVAEGGVRVQESDARDPWPQVGKNSPRDAAPPIRLINIRSMQDHTIRGRTSSGDLYQ